MTMNVPAWISATIIVSMITIVIVTWIGFYRVPLSPGNHKMSSSLAVGAFLLGWLALASALGLQGFFRQNPAMRIPGIAYSAIPLVVGDGLTFVSTTLRKTV